MPRARAEGISAGPYLGSYGHIPNGGRIYYLQRSQPPLLTLMVDRYVAHTNNTAFLRYVPHLYRPAGLPLPETSQGEELAQAEVWHVGLHPRENIETLALELDFWTVNRSVSVNLGGQNYTLNRYYVPYGGPR